MFERMALIKQTLEKLSTIYDDKYLFSSVLSVVRNFFDDPDDKEVWTLFCALVDKQVPVVSRLVPMLEDLASEITKRHYKFIEFVYESSSVQREILGKFTWYGHAREGPREYHGWSHRIITSDTIICFFAHLKEFLDEHGTLSAFFRTQYQESTSIPKLESVIRRFCRDILARNCPPKCKVTRGNYSRCRILGTMIPSPSGTSAFKTLCLFLRWMVRPYPDLGLWDFIPTSDLLYPMDVGVIRVLKRLGLIEERENKWQMVIEATNAIKKYFNEQDPVKFDFALSRLGILRFCQKQLERSFCSACPFYINNACPSALSHSQADQFYETLFERQNARNIIQIKGEYLELKVATALVAEGYRLDFGFKYLPVLPKYRELLLQHGCMMVGNRMELDVVARNERNSSMFKVVECKYHRRPVSRKDVECFGAKVANFNEYLKEEMNLHDGQVVDAWFVAPNGFFHNCESTASKYGIKLFSRDELNALLKEKGMRLVPTL